MQDVLLFIQDGYIELLETYRGDSEVPTGMPQAKDLMLSGPDGPTPWPNLASGLNDV